MALSTPPHWSRKLHGKLLTCRTSCSFFRAAAAQPSRMTSRASTAPCRAAAEESRSAALAEIEDLWKDVLGREVDCHDVQSLHSDKSSSIGLGHGVWSSGGTQVAKLRGLCHLFNCAIERNCCCGLFKGLLEVPQGWGSGERQGRGGGGGGGGGLSLISRP